MIGEFGFTEVVLFGTGGLLEHAMSRLAERGVKVSYLVDNNPDKHGQKIFGIEVLKPERIAATGLPVLITSMWARDIAMQLRSLGVERYADFSYVSDFD